MIRNIQDNQIYNIDNMIPYGFSKLNHAGANNLGSFNKLEYNFLFKLWKGFCILQIEKTEYTWGKQIILDTKVKFCDNIDSNKYTILPENNNKFSMKYCHTHWGYVPTDKTKNFKYFGYDFSDGKYDIYIGEENMNANVKSRYCVIM